MVENEYIHLLKAAQLFEWRRYNEAMEEAMQHLQFDPQSEDAFCIIANCWHFKGDNEKELKFYEKALKINPSNYNALYNISRFYLQTDQFEAFDQINQTALSYYPESSYLHVARGWYYFERNDQDAAQICADKALRIDPDNSFAHALCSQIAAVRFEYRKSRYHEKRALAHEHEDPDLWSLLAGATITRGDFRRTVQMAEQAVSLSPTPSFIRQLHSYRIADHWWYRWSFHITIFHQRLFKKSWLLWIYIFMLTLVLKVFIVIYILLMIGLPLLSNDLRKQLLEKEESIKRPGTEEPE